MRVPSCAFVLAKGSVNLESSLASKSRDTTATCDALKPCTGAIRVPNPGPGTWSLVTQLADNVLNYKTGQANPAKICTETLHKSYAGPRPCFCS